MQLTDHSKTLINHVYTKSSIDNITSGIALFDLSDHLPVVCLINVEIKRNDERIHCRDYSAFNKDAYFTDINLINWNSVPNADRTDDLNISTVQVMDTLAMVTNKHAPIKISSFGTCIK